jgi:hypothetical protein
MLLQVIRGRFNFRRALGQYGVKDLSGTNPSAWSAAQCALSTLSLSQASFESLAGDCRLIHFELITPFALSRKELRDS